MMDNELMVPLIIFNVVYQVKSVMKEVSCFLGNQFKRIQGRERGVKVVINKLCLISTNNLSFSKDIRQLTIRNTAGDVCCIGII